MGEISIEANHDLILFRQGEKVTIYPAHRIQSFNFYDAQANINRKFLSLKNSHTVIRVHQLYEIVLLGDISVLRRQKKELFVQHTNSDKFDFDYYLRWNNQLVELASFRKMVYPELLKTFRNEIISFVNEKDLNPGQPASAIQIIEFYNRQTKPVIFANIY